MSAPRFLVASLFAVLLFLLSAGAVRAETAFPKKEGAINDFADIIPPRRQALMESLSREVLQKTGTAVVVATLDTIGDGDPADYANRLYEAWGIGTRGQDRGVLIMLALQERRIRIETGYGVEGILPDGRVGGILDRYVRPLLKAGRYDEGLQNALVAVSGVIAEDAGVALGQGLQPQVEPRRGQRPRGGVLSLLPLLFILLAMCTRSGRRMLPLLLLMGMAGGRRPGFSSGFGSGFGGGGFGGFGGGLSGGGGAGRSF